MRNTISIGLLFFIFQIFAQPGTVSEHLKVDQFGYPPDVQKICVVNNPTAGFDFDAGDFYTPGATLQVVKAADNSIVMSGPAVAWHGGASYDQSGDVVWWFDFSSLTSLRFMDLLLVTSLADSIHTFIRIRPTVEISFLLNCSPPSNHTKTGIPAGRKIHGKSQRHPSPTRDHM